MAKTVTVAMTDFLANIQPTTTQVSGISASHTALRSYLKNNLSVVDDFLTGSYRRNTMVRQSRDVDMFLVLSSDYWYGTQLRPGYGYQANGPANLLDRVKRLLQDKYAQTNISRDGQAVRVEFQHIHMDVVPVFVTNSGYVLPDSHTNSWLQSNPRKHAEAASATNALRGNRLVPLTKMLKSWNLSNGYGMKGFFLEMWARDIFQHHALDSYANGLETFFSCTVQWLDKGFTIPDPASGANLADAYLGTAEGRTRARKRLVAANDLALSAIGSNLSGDNASAIKYWKRLFGDPFPSYG